MRLGRLSSLGFLNTFQCSHPTGQSYLALLLVPQSTDTKCYLCVEHFAMFVCIEHYSYLIYIAGQDDEYVYGLGDKDRFLNVY